MDMQGNRQLAATQEQAWAALNNPDILKACIPGCEKFELTEENNYNVGVALRIGPVAAKFSGTVKLMDIQPPHSYALQFEAQGGVAGFGKGESKVNLTPNPEGCELSYTVHSKVGGKIAQLGQRLIDGAAKSLAEDFFKRFEEELLKSNQAQSQSEAELAPTPTAADKPAPKWLWLAAAVLAGALIWSFLRS
jgi:carbon monoxide dehydrogenase subunit G